MMIVFIVDKTFAGLLVPAALVLLLFLVIFLVARRQARPAPSIHTHESPQRKTLEETPNDVASDRSHFPLYSSSYQKPLFLLLDAARSGSRTFVHTFQHAVAGEQRHAHGGTGYGIARLDRATILQPGRNLPPYVTQGNGALNEWKKYIDHIQRRRPQRPLDGVILTLACGDFMGDHAASREESQSHAAQISKNLLLLRDRVGFAFPIYVLITDCNEIRGFSEFVGGQLLSHTSEIFGWSNPYNLDASFDPRWSTEAFDYAHNRIEEQRVYSFGQSHNGGTPAERSLSDELFLFPARFREIEAPVSDFLEALFRNSGHRDALQFRGLYFSGKTQSNNGANGHSKAAAGDFIADLFNQKIIPERGLAHPVDTELAPRNRESYLARAICCVAATVLCFGTALAWYGLSATREKALFHLDKVAAALAKPQKSQAPAAYDAIYTAQALSGNNFRSFFLPFSFLSDFDLKLRTTMPKVFERLVYPGLGFELTRCANELVRDDKPCTTEPGGETLSRGSGPATLSRLERMVKAPRTQQNDSDPCKGEQGSNTGKAANPRPGPTASQRLASFINGESLQSKEGLLSLEDNFELFNSFAPGGGGTGREMMKLAGNMAPCTFAGLSRKPTETLNAIVALSNGAPLDGGTWNSLAVSQLESLVADVLRQRLDEDQLLATVTATMDQINRLEARDLDTNQQLSALDKSLAQVQQQLGAPGLEWLAKNEYQLPPDIQQALDPVFERAPAQNALLCDPRKEAEQCEGLIRLRLFIWPAAHTHCLDFRTALLSTRTNLTGDLIIGNDDKLQLSPGALTLQTALDGFLKLPFVEHQGTGQIQDVRAGEQLIWNSSKLQDALANKAAFDKFFSNDLANADETLQDVLEEIGLDRLESSMTDSVASAQEFQQLPLDDKTEQSAGKAEQATMEEARAFAAAAQPLAQLLDELSELNFDDEYPDLSRVSTDHAMMVLTRVDLYFESKGFYWPATHNFDLWTGSAPPTTAVYDKPSMDAMLGYLALQRQDWQPYVAAAGPLATFLQQRGLRGPKQSAVVSKWLGIASDVQKYESAPASSTLGSLENYLTIEMDKVAPPDCQTTAAPAVPVYFAQTQRSIAHALSVRCRSLTHDTGNLRYIQLAQFFNEHLAGRFPFSNLSNGYAEADPADVAELYRLLDADNKAVHASVEGHAPARSFVNQLEALRPIFASLFSPQPDQAPAWDFVPVFRANRSHEVNGNQIIDWSFTAGNTTFRNSDPAKIGHWSFGQPVALTLRWAKDSPNRPIAGTPGNNLPETKTVVYEYHDPWALLRILVEHAAPLTDFDRKVDPDPQTLAFIIGQQVVPQPPAKGRISSLIPENQTAGSDVKVFVGIRLYPPGKTTSLSLPAFPVEAPAQ